MEYLCAQIETRDNSFLSAQCNAMQIDLTCGGKVVARKHRMQHLIPLVPSPIFFGELIFILAPS